MQIPSRTYQAEVYEQFLEIEDGAHHDIIQFYELHTESIDHLELKTYFEVRIAYGMAIFEVGRYRDYLDLAQELAEGIIFHNIEWPYDDNWYEKVLLKKAAAHYQLIEYREAEFILWQLLRMYPDNQVAAFLLKRTLIRNQPRLITDLKGVSILLFLVAAGMIALELLVVRPFFGDWIHHLEVARSSVFGIGLALLVGADLWHRSSCVKRVNKAISHQRDHIA